MVTTDERELVQELPEPTATELALKVLVVR